VVTKSARQIRTVDPTRYPYPLRESESRSREVPGSSLLVAGPYPSEELRL
jgi:hypothetical protein